MSSGRGFHIIEVLALLVIFGVLIVMAVPYLLQGVLVNSQIDGAVERVLADLHRAQVSARSMSGMGRFNYAGGTYRIEVSADSGETWAAVSSPQWFELAANFRGVSLVGVKDASGTDLSEIRFDARGTANSTPIAARFPMVVQLSSGTETRTILVHRTGNIVRP